MEVRREAGVGVSEGQLGVSEAGDECAHFWMLFVKSGKPETPATSMCPSLLPRSVMS